MEATRRSTMVWDDELDRIWQAPERERATAVIDPEPPHTLAPDRIQPAPRRIGEGAGSATPSWMLRVVAIATLGLIAVAAIVGLSDWGRIQLDDLRYGRPRTTHLTAFVGHGDADGVPTQLLAMNLNRRITIVEIPGGDPAKIRTIVGPYLVGKNEDLTVATMRLHDVNGDGHADLLVRVKNEEVVYINDRGEFRLMTRAERPTVERVLGGDK